mmetsp:Transcript_24227/g.77352  ORF Transcript_24227/g.77352 Transcript_24227/m.77352 type:complete len:215 (-) Transcript_24227:241-885(-)
MARLQRSVRARSATCGASFGRSAAARVAPAAQFILARRGRACGALAVGRAGVARAHDGAVQGLAGVERGFRGAPVREVGLRCDPVRAARVRLGAGERVHRGPGHGGLAPPRVLYVVVRGVGEPRVAARERQEIGAPVPVHVLAGMGIVLLAERRTDVAADSRVVFLLLARDPHLGGPLRERPAARGRGVVAPRSKAAAVTDSAARVARPVPRRV